MKKCPYCAEEIQNEAVICKHCKRDLSQVLPPPAIESNFVLKQKDKSGRSPFFTRFVGIYMKECPHCGKQIEEEATICKNCNRDLSQTASAGAVKSSRTTKKCRQCQTDISYMAQKCPHCQSDLRNWFVRHPILTIILALFVGIPFLSGIISGLTGSKNIIDTKTAQQTATSSAENIQQIKAEAEAQLAAQAAFDKSPAGKICKQHPSWSQEDCTRIANHKIWVGMSYEMLVLEYGRPNHINPSNYGRGTQYQYCWDNYTPPNCFYDNNGDGIIDAYN